MAKISDVEFNGRLGKYKFEVYPIGTSFNAVGAVYIFTKRTVDAAGNGLHDFIYIGQTESLKDRMPDHNKLQRVLACGANCVCVHRDDDQASRLQKETDLRSINPTSCNEQ